MNKLFNIKNLAIVAMFSIISVVGLSAYTTKMGNKEPEKKAALYWYQVSYDDPTNFPDGYIKTGTAVYSHAEKASVTSPCAAGSAKDCLRGFTSELSSLPNDDEGTDQIKRPN
ncbi:hypothetical protein [Pedobacter nototheniae]|uniref:hypothetical protein n=1 Tax=Pedobacter nototheniae TaxID=2488994 RepID=UPI0010399214|nr:hypothetical protein [Pedobacter nototheniae]